MMPYSIESTLHRATTICLNRCVRSSNSDAPNARRPRDLYGVALYLGMIALNDIVPNKRRSRNDRIGHIWSVRVFVKVVVWPKMFLLELCLRKALSSQHGMAYSGLRKQTVMSEN